MIACVSTGFGGPAGFYGDKSLSENRTDRILGLTNRLFWAVGDSILRVFHGWARTKIVTAPGVS